MYFTAKFFLASYPPATNPRLEKVLKAMNIKPEETDSTVEVEVTVGYWRKANAIHNWFVKNVQGGVDNCSAYHIPLDYLTLLRAAVQKALSAFDKGDFETAKSVLPPTEGFFFGSTDMNAGYREDLVTTLEILNRTDNKAYKGADFYYRSSW